MSEHHPKDCNSATKKLLEILRNEVFDDDKSNFNNKPDPGFEKTREEKKSQQLSLFPFMDPEAESEE